MTVQTLQPVAATWEKQLRCLRWSSGRERRLCLKTESALQVGEKRTVRE